MANHAQVHGQRRAADPAPSHKPDRGPGYEHGQRGQHERGAEDGPDADLARGHAAAEQNRDQRNHRLRQRRTDGRQHRPDRSLAQLELMPEPLDAVGEQL